MRLLKKRGILYEDVSYENIVFLDAKVNLIRKDFSYNFSEECEYFGFPSMNVANTLISRILLIGVLPMSSESITKSAG